MKDDAPYLSDPSGRRFPITRAVTTLGRSLDCDVFIADQRASRLHAEVHWDGKTCILRHRSNTNSTLLNGRSVSALQTLHNGDEITIASATFTYRDPEGTVRVSGLPLLVVDEASGEIWVSRRAVALSRKERALFGLLHRYRGCVMSKQQIAEAVWPEYQAEVYDYQVESLVKRLREKLEPDPRNPVLVQTVAGYGYKLVPDR